MYQLLKRTLDITVAAATLLLLLPFIVPIVLLLRLTAEGEVLYLQDRMGYKNRVFKIWKFATMLKNSPNMLTGSLTLRNDPRVTTIGKYLRITKMNELPQVVNVLKGDMSLVGPRPQVRKDFLAYPAHIQARIYEAKPGVTSIGSVLFRDEEKLLSVTSLPPHDFYRLHIAPYKGELELWYQQRASFLNDLIIIFLTGWEIFFPDSELAFKVFSDLPKRPVELTVNGAREVGLQTVNG